MISGIASPRVPVTYLIVLGQLASSTCNVSYFDCHSYRAIQLFDISSERFSYCPVRANS